MSLANLSDKIKRYYAFDKNEIIGLAASILIIAFIISLDWPRVELFDFINSVLIVALTFLVVESVVRIAALSMGHKIEYQVFTVGLVIGFIVSIVSRGFFWFLMPNGFKLEPLTTHRLGHHRYEVDYFTSGVISLFAPITHIVLAIFFKSLYSVIPNSLLLDGVKLNAVMAVYQILPIPPMAGSKVFFGSRMLFSFAFVGIIAAALFLSFLPIPAWLSILGALVIAAICWLLYYIFFEKDFWRGPHPK